MYTGAFLAAAVWGGHLGGHVCIWGGGRIPEVLMHDWVSGVIRHQLRDATLLCNPATLQPVSLGGGAQGRAGVLTGGHGRCPPPPGHPLEPPLHV